MEVPSMAQSARKSSHQLHMERTAEPPTKSSRRGPTPAHRLHSPAAFPGPTCEWCQRRRTSQDGPTSSVNVINPRQLVTGQHSHPDDWRMGLPLPRQDAAAPAGRTTGPQEPDVSVGRRWSSPIDAANRCPSAKLHQPATPTPNATYSTLFVIDSALRHVITHHGC